MNRIMPRDIGEKYTRPTQLWNVALDPPLVYDLEVGLTACVLYTRRVVNVSLTYL